MDKAKSPTGTDARKRKPGDEEKRKLQESLRQQKRINDKLRKELKNKRIRLSVAIGDIIKYTEKHKDRDPLVSGFKFKENPFKEKGGCIIL